MSAGFDWNACVTAFDERYLTGLATWRGYSPEFCRWLGDQRLIGLHDGGVALPVRAPGGDVVGCHLFQRANRAWRFVPTGLQCTPLVIGGEGELVTQHVFESQWDAFAVIDRSGAFADGSLAATQFVITRGAANGRKIADLISPTADLFAWPQNDAINIHSGKIPAEQWMAAIQECAPGRVRRVSTPPDFKDLNDWTRGGASASDIQAAVQAARDQGTGLATPSSAAGEAGGNMEEPADPFPTDLLPPVLAKVIREVSRGLGVPECLPGSICLGLLAGSIGKGLVLDWRPGKSPTPANLFCILAAPSGSGKSEAHKLLAAPLLDLERAAQERWHREVLPTLSEEVRYTELRLKAIDSKLSKASVPQTEVANLRHESRGLIHQMESIKARMEEPQLTVQDATVERITGVLDANQETTLSIAADARKLVDNLLGRYSANKKLADDAIYLSGYSGDAIRVDRQNRPSVRLTSPCLSLIWALQPDALEMLLDADSLQHGGWLARCLLVQTNATPQYMTPETPAMDASALAAWDGLIKRLLTTYRKPQLISTRVDDEILAE